MATVTDFHKLIRYLVFFLALFFLLPVYRIASRKKEDIVGFACDWFRGNIKYLYEEMKKYEGIKIYLVTKYKKELARIKSSNIVAYYDMDVTKIPLFLRTSVWITDMGSWEIPIVGTINRIFMRLFGFPYRQRKHRSKWVDVWHGGMGFKYVGREEMLADYDVGFVTSEFFRRYYSRKSGISHKLKITGNPRTDPLIKRAMSRENVLKDIGVPPKRRNILYAPTRPHKERKAFFPWEQTDKIIEDLERFCDKNDSNFLVRLHPWYYTRTLKETEKLKQKIEQSKNIFDVSSEKHIDVQGILYITDVLITDWSSIANDFILLDRPIIFLDVELPVQEFKLTPNDRVGYIVKDKKEFFEKLQEAIDRPKLFERKRKTLIRKLYKHLDGNSSKRCAQEIIKLLRQ